MTDEELIVGLKRMTAALGEDGVESVKALERDAFRRGAAYAVSALKGVADGLLEVASDPRISWKFVGHAPPKDAIGLPD